MAVKPKSSVKSKAASKPKPAVKKKSKVKPYKKITSKQYNIADLAEDIISNVCVGIYIVQNGNFVYVSPLFQKLSGYSHSDLLGTNPLDHIHPEDRKTVRQKAIKSLKRKCGSYEYRFVIKNGEIIWVMEMITSITYKGKRAALGSFIDITEHKRTEDELRRSEGKYRTIIENMQEIYFEDDLAGNLTFVNDALCRSLGYTREELIGMNYKQYTEESNVKKLNELYGSLLKTGDPVTSMDMEAVRKDGKKIIYDTSVSLIRNAQGKPVGFRGVARDVTERKRMEDKLRQSEEKYRTIIEGIEDGYAELDLSGKITFFNKALSEILGYPEDELKHLDTNNRQYVDEETAKYLQKIYNNTYATGKSEKDIQYEIMAKDGTKRNLDGAISLIRDTTGRPVGFRGIVRDRTESRQAEEVLRQSEEKYRTIIEQMTDGYYEIDLAGKFTFVNDVVCEHLGYTREELIGMAPQQYQDEITVKKMFHNYTEIYKTGKPAKAVESEYIRKDGTKGTYEMSPSLIRDAQGKPIGFRGTSRDITERKKADDVLRASEEKYRTIIETMQDGYLEMDLLGKYTFSNDVICEHLGYPREELIGATADKFQDEENYKKTLRDFAEIYKTGKPVKSLEVECTRKDGTRGIYELSSSLMRDAGGKAIGFRSISRDITERKQMEEKIRQSEERYRTIIEQMEDGYFEIDLRGVFTFVNNAECRNIGYSREEIIGKDSHLFGDENTYKTMTKFFTDIYKTGKSVYAYDIELIKKDGTKAYNEISAALIRNAQGEPSGFRGIARDVTERKLLEEKIRQSEERYRTIIEEMEEWYFETDLTGNITFFNDIFANVLGYSQKKLTGLNFRDFIKKEESESVYRLFNQVFKTGKSTKNFPYAFVRPDGTVTSAEFSIFPKWDKEAKIVGFRGVGHDITERKRAEEKIQYMATHDALTGLPNRLMFSQLLNHAIQSAKRYQRQFAIFFIDLDRFKTINDSLGHAAGDQLLQEIALRFKQSLRAVDVVGRLGGDEFVILIEEISDSSQIATVAHKILTAAIKPMVLLGEECRVTASIGISMYPKDAEDEQALMQNADIAMYLAKEEGKNNYQFYSEDIQSKSIERLSIETNLRFALERNELSLHYQAKVDFKTNAITGVEALLRWQNPYLGSVTPTQFIPVAEESWLIIPIGRWVIRTACAQNVAWQRDGLPPVCMAVNLSPRQLMDEFLIEDIKNALNDSGMAPNLLELEITESMVMHNPTRMIAVLAKIKNLGVRLAIDDFGTGYSSLGQLKHFPIDTLKVDRSFIRNIPQDAEDKAITEAIIAMGKTLSLTVVAEGVETIEQLNFLKDHSCDEMQGFYFSKPIAPDQFAELLRKHVPSPQK